MPFFTGLAGIDVARLASSQFVGLRRPIVVKPLIGAPIFPLIQRFLFDSYCMPGLLDSPFFSPNSALHSSGGAGQLIAVVSARGIMCMSS